jgi:hypothetical protein
MVPLGKSSKLWLPTLGCEQASVSHDASCVRTIRCTTSDRAITFGKSFFEFSTSAGSQGCFLRKACGLGSRSEHNRVGPGHSSGCDDQHTTCETANASPAGQWGHSWSAIAGEDAISEWPLNLRSSRWCDREARTSRFHRPICALAIDHRI